MNYVVPVPQKYQQMLQAAADKYKVPANLLALVIHAESGFRPNAVGDNGSSFGFFQIHLPAHPDISKEQAMDPQFNLDWGARYLASAYHRYGGNALAALLHNNAPAAADHYARTGQWGPTPGLAAASQRYLTLVLAPLGGFKGVQRMAGSVSPGAAQMAEEAAKVPEGEQVEKPANPAEGFLDATRMLGFGPGEEEDLDKGLGFGNQT